MVTITFAINNTTAKFQAELPEDAVKTVKDIRANMEALYLASTGEQMEFLIIRAHQDRKDKEICRVRATDEKGTSVFSISSISVTLPVLINPSSFVVDEESGIRAGIKKFVDIKQKGKVIATNVGTGLKRQEAKARAALTTIGYFASGVNTVHIKPQKEALKKSAANFLRNLAAKVE